jgi:hypothetical protein
MSLFEKLYQFLHEDVAAPIAEEFARLEARIERLEGGKPQEVPHATEEGKVEEGSIGEHQQDGAGGVSAEASGSGSPGPVPTAQTEVQG